MYNPQPSPLSNYQYMSLSTEPIKALTAADFSSLEQQTNWEKTLKELSTFVSALTADNVKWGQIRWFSPADNPAKLILQQERWTEDPLYGKVGKTWVNIPVAVS
jgi:hypothetical protein